MLEYLPKEERQEGQRSNLEGAVPGQRGELGVGLELVPKNPGLGVGSIPVRH